MKRYTFKLGVALAAVAAAGGGVACAQTHDDAVAGGARGETATDLSFQLAMAGAKRDEAAAPALPETSLPESPLAESPVADSPPATDVPVVAPAVTAPVAASPVFAIIADSAAGAPKGTPKPVPAGPVATATTPGPDGLLDGGAYIEADNMREMKDKTVIAYGHVQMRYKGKTIFADQVSYDPSTQITIATGNTVTIDEDGSTQFADSAVFDNNMNQGASTNFADLGADHTKIFARHVDRLNENTNQMENIIYTPCEICAANGSGKTPTWSIAASKVTQRKDKEMVYYDNAIILAKGIPVFYAPLLWTPDPEMPRASGLLQPKPGYSRKRGFSLEQPYLQILSPYSYVIIDPQFNTKVNPLLNLEYKRRFYSGDLDVRFGFTNDKFFDNAGRKWGTSETRDYLIADGKFKINSDWRWSFTAEHVKDPNKDVDLTGTALTNSHYGKPYGDNANFFERYGIENAFDQHGELTVDSRELINQVNLTRQTPNSFLSLSMANFQTLQIAGYAPLSAATTRPYVVNNDLFPTVAPLIEGYWSPDYNIFGGQFTAAMTGIGLQHKVYPGSTVAPAIADGTTGFDTARVTATVSWISDQVWGTSGFKGGPFFDLRHDYYHESDLTSAGLATNASRDLATAGFNISYPLFRKFKNVAVVVEPVAQLAVSPKYQANPDIPTEDSQSLEFDETDLLTPDRSPGFDVYESGARLNMGVRTSWLWDKGMKINTLIGRTVRDDVQTQFLRPATDPDNKLTATDSSGATVNYDPYGLAYKASDWIADGDFDTGKGLYGYSRIRLDSDTLRLKQGEAGLSVYSTRTTATLRYIVNDTNPVVDATVDPLNPKVHKLISVDGPNYRDVQIYARHFLTNNWGVSARLDRDLLLDKWRRSTLSLIYKDDCIWIEMIYERNDTVLNTVNGKPQQGFLLQIKPLILGISGSTEFHDVR